MVRPESFKSAPSLLITALFLSKSSLSKSSLAYLANINISLALSLQLLAAGEEVTIYISVWVDKDALNKVGVYPNDDISLEAVFTSGEVTS